MAERETQRVFDYQLAISSYRRAFNDLEKASIPQDITAAKDELSVCEWGLVMALSALEEQKSWRYDRQELSEVRERVNNRYPRFDKQTSDLRSLLFIIDSQDTYIYDLGERVQGLIDLCGRYQRDTFDLLGRVRKNVKRAWQAR